MRPGLPRPLFSTRASRRGQTLLLAIGQTEEEGQVFCYRFDNQGRHTNLLYLYYGDDRYQLWRAYMSALAEIEEEDWNIERRDMPRVSEVESI